MARIVNSVIRFAARVPVAKEVPATEALPVTKPVFAARTTTVSLVLADNPETVTNPPALIETVELRPDVADHEYDESKLVI